MLTVSLLLDEWKVSCVVVRDHHLIVAEGPFFITAAVFFLTFAVPFLALFLIVIVTRVIIILFLFRQALFGRITGNLAVGIEPDSSHTIFRQG